MEELFIHLVLLELKVVEELVVEVLLVSKLCSVLE